MIEFRCRDACHYKGKLWTIDMSELFISYIDMEDWKLEQVELIDDINPKVYRKVVINEDNLFFVADNGCNILKYNIETKQKFVYEQSGITKKMLHSVLHGMEIVIIPQFFYNELYLFNINTCQFKILKFQTDEYKTDEEAFVPSVQIVKNHLWITINQGRTIMSLNLLTQEVDKYILPKKISVGGICAFENIFLLISVSGYKVYKWSPLKGFLAEYTLEGICEDNDIYSEVIVCNKKIYIISRIGDGIYKLNEKSKTIRKICSVEKYEKIYTLFLGTLILDKNIIILPWGAKKLIQINCETDEIKEIEIETKNDYILNVLNAIFQKNILMYEDRNFDLKNILSEVSSMDKRRNNNERRDNKGEYIFKKILSL